MNYMELILIIGLLVLGLYAWNNRVSTKKQRSIESKTSPWTIIGWIVLVCVLLILAFCANVAYNIGQRQLEADKGIAPSSAYQAPERAATPLYAKQIAMSCTDNKIEVTVRNTGTTTISYAKGFLQAHNKAGDVLEAKDSYFRPTDIPPGSVASVDVYLDGRNHKSCSMLEMQDGNGQRVTVSQ